MKKIYRLSVYLLLAHLIVGCFGGGIIVTGQNKPVKPPPPAHHPPGKSVGHKSHKHGPPPWAPAHGYRAKTRYVFFPEIGTYFDLTKKKYIYSESNKWVFSLTLPLRHKNYNLKNAPQNELDYGGETPYVEFKKHKQLYSSKKHKGKPDKGNQGKGKGKGN